MIEDFREYSYDVVEGIFDVNRRIINQLTEERDGAVYDRDQSRDMERQMSEVAMEYQNKLEAQDDELKSAYSKIAKLRGVIESLKLDLGNEREAHTKYKENHEKD